MFTTERQFHEPATMLTPEPFVSHLSTCSVEHAPHGHVPGTSSRPVTWSAHTFSLFLNSLNSVLIFVNWNKQPIVSAKQPIVFLMLCCLLCVLCTVPSLGIDQRSESTHGGTPQGTQGRKVNRLTARVIASLRRRPREASPRRGVAQERHRLREASPESGIAR